MNDNIEVPNAALRAHVSDHSFVLSLRKTHIFVLNDIAHNQRTDDRRGGAPAFFITAVHALIRRGLIVHKHAPNFIGESYGKLDEPITNYYRLTRAGWAVFDLLVEAGMADAIDKRSSLRRIVA
jgi:hypothetical protein